MEFGETEVRNIYLQAQRELGPNGSSKKENGVFRARLVGKGHDQIAGIDSNIISHL